ncbi:MAG: hypothetical protein ACM30I_06520 [Gemmatimonas sp.]
MRAESEIRTTPGADAGKTAVLSEKMRAAMAKMMAAAKAAKARREQARRLDARSRFKAALSPARWRNRAGRWFPARFAAATAVVLPDPPLRVLDFEAQLVADALTRLAPAIGRAAVHGEPITVTVADGHTADVFREALTRTERTTDRLVRIVVREG